MDLLYLLEGIRVPVLNEFMLLITQLGEETAFLAIALFVFWCVNKYQGYYIMSVGFVGTLANQFMKLWFRIPRPFVQDPNFTILEQAREAASGYSFPSGHTQCAVGTFGSIAYITKKKWIRIACLIIAAFVPFSRMYIGVHTPLDVFVATAMAIVLIFLLKPIFLNENRKHVPLTLVIMVCLAVAYLCFVEFYHFPADIDAENYASGVENAYTLFGALLGVLVVYFVDEKWLHFSTKAVWWAQIIKTLLGIGVVLAVQGGLKTPLNALFGNCAGRMIRYFFVVIVAGIVWPLTFKWFSKLSSGE